MTAGPGRTRPAPRSILPRLADRPGRTCGLSDPVDVLARIRTRSVRICPEMRHRRPKVRTTPRLADGSTPACVFPRDSSAGIGPPPGRVLPDGRLQCYRADPTFGSPMPSSAPPTECPDPTGETACAIDTFVDLTILKPHHIHIFKLSGRNPRRSDSPSEAAGSLSAPTLAPAHEIPSTKLNPCPPDPGGVLRRLKRRRIDDISCAEPMSLRRIEPES